MAKMTIVGVAGFNNLKEARGFKGEETKKTFGLELLLTQEEANAFVTSSEKVIERLYAETVESEKAKGRKVLVRKPISLKDMPDGMIRVSFKRKEDDKAPHVVGKDKEPYISFLKRGARVKVAYELVPYVMQGVFGVSLRLVGVQVLEDELTSEDISKLFDDEETIEPVKKEVAAKDLF